MKKSSWKRSSPATTASGSKPASHRPADHRRSPAIAAIVLLGVAGAAAHATRAVASPELDRRYALTSIGVLRAWDDVDGLFGERVARVYREKLATLPRFAVRDLGEANGVLEKAKLPYGKVIEDPQILAQLAKTYRLDSLLRTRVRKERGSYRFTVDWIHAAKSELIGSETATLAEGPGEGGRIDPEAIRKTLEGMLDRLVARVPFRGSVTGRDQSSITVNLGSGSGLAKGDTLSIATLDEVRFHPLLKTIVDWRLTPTGTATVTDVEESIAFAKIDAEESGRSILRYQKVARVIPAPEGARVDARITDREAMAKAANDPPRLGYVAPGLLLGTGARDASGTSGSGFLYGAKAEAQAWFTSAIFGELKLDYGSAAYAQPAGAGVAALPASRLNLSQTRVAVGYFHHVTSNFFGPKGWLKLGYQRAAYGLPRDLPAKTGEVAVAGAFLGIGGDLPVRTDFGLSIDVDFGLFGGGTEEAKAYGAVSGSTSVNFSVGGYVWLHPKLRAQAALDFKSQSIDFENGGSLAYRAIAVAPSVSFYF